MGFQVRTRAPDILFIRPHTPHVAVIQSKICVRKNKNEQIIFETVAIYTKFLGFSFKQCSLWKAAIMNSVIKGFLCSWQTGIVNTDCYTLVLQVCIWLFEFLIQLIMVTINKTGIHLNTRTWGKHSLSLFLYDNATYWSSHWWTSHVFWRCLHS